jgi:hypothetical protein
MHSQWGEIWLWRKDILFTLTIIDETYAAALMDRSTIYIHENMCGWILFYSFL